MIKQTVIYNIPVHTDNANEYRKLNDMYGKFLNEFKQAVKHIYKGSCKIQVTVGTFKFEYPHQIRKQLLPQMHIIISGKYADNIDELVEIYLNKRFKLISYEKLYIDKNPFSKYNDKLFSTISYMKYILRINNVKNRIFLINKNFIKNILN